MLIDGRYEIQEKIGQGAFGITFKAVDTKRPGNPWCIVKQFHPINPDYWDAGKKLFEREAEKLEQLGHHEQIPRLLGYFCENQEYYLVQEYIEGYDLSQELVIGTQLSETYIIQLLRDILEVLKFVHQQGLIHRDIKPSNIRRRISDRKIVLIDFGAVKQVTTQMVNAQGQVIAATIIGTPGYMPTEQLNGHPVMSSDIYAVGIIAIQGLTGISEPSTALKSQNGDIVWRDRISVSPKLADIIDKMVHRDSSQRYPSATEAFQAIQTLLAKPQPRPWKIWLGAGLVTVIFAVIIWILSQIIHPQHTWESYTEPKYNITIKYPSDEWQLIKITSDFGGEVVKIIPKNKPRTGACTLEIVTNIKDLSGQLLSVDEAKNTAIQQIKNINSNQKITDETKPSTSLSKFPAYQLIYTRPEGQCNLKVMEIGTVRNGKAYFITYTAEEKEYNRYSEVVEEMINSFAIKAE